jgi:hypothetical protein
MNRLRLRLFATLRERACRAELNREFPDGTTVTEIWNNENYRRHSLFRNGEIVCQEIDHVLAILLWIFFPQLAVSCSFPNPDRLWLARMIE